MPGVCTEPGCPNLKPCPAHPKPTGKYGTRNPDRDLVAHNRWARAVKKRDGYRCQARGPHEGPLHAHHIRPGYDLDAGITLCRRHHKAADVHAR